MHAFISHSSQDAGFASRLVQLLEAEGIRCWIAPRDLPGGSAYAEELMEAIESSGCVAVVFTDAANTSLHVLREVERAITYRRPLLPPVPAEVKPSRQFDYFFATVHRPSVPGVSHPDAATTYAEAISKYIGRMQSEPSSPKPPADSPGAALDSLWHLATDLELRYRKACRENVSDEDWVGVDAIQITLNEFLVINRRHFPRELQMVAQEYSRSVARLAAAARACNELPGAKDFASTRIISKEELEKGTELFEANEAFEEAHKVFEAIFERCRHPRGAFFGRLFGRRA